MAERVQDMYFVDQTMRAVALTSMYSDRYIAQMHARWPGPVAEADTQPLPVSPDGQLVAGEFYASSVDPSIHYALPQYQVHVADGRYQASLRWIANPAVRSDPIGVLTIDLAGPLPSAPGFSVQEIAHTAIVRLRYRQPLDDRTRPRGMPAELFAGEWRNTDRATRGMTRLVIERVDATTVSFHGYGACQPEDCDWGVVQAQVRGDRAMGIYDFGWKQTRIVVSRTGAQLIAEVIDDYTEADGRQDRSATYTLETRAAEQALPPFAYELGALNPIGPALRRCEMPIYERADFDRIYQIMTEQRFGGMLELRCFATVGHRSWRQVVTSGSFDWLRRPLAQSIAQPSVPATRPISASIFGP
ncbi:MAG: hypothetical protein H7Z42_00155, partial [Roseiflexaceae bacterium]|nr:hypothetical protein [Roseiflexaceae bacterium]